METSTSEGKHGIQRTAQSQLDDLNFTDNLALPFHTHQQMQIRKTSVTKASPTCDKSAVIHVCKDLYWESVVKTVTKAGYRVLFSAACYLNYISYGDAWRPRGSAVAERLWTHGSPNTTDFIPRVEELRCRMLRMALDERQDSSKVTRFIPLTTTRATSCIDKWNVVLGRILGGPVK
ncbi:unnamed protein product [Schistosoma margrebowiei]|uniref:Uncharacterized protein n=1 Tax=Schistosoma margrebowiei TaxID=48269 RepID=A0A183N4S4_9TREM|nr:unnamed protein product [Schistosoma margrebowiei]